MEFKIDEQTLNDLELFNQALDGKSIFSCFNTACSDGGKACIRKMLERPLTDVNKIRGRVEAIRYLGQLPFFLDIRREELSFIEVYLQQEDVPQRSMYHLTSRAVKGCANVQSRILGGLSVSWGLLWTSCQRGECRRW